MSITTQQKHEDSEQEVLNKSVDPQFGVLAIELLGYDPDNNVLRRVSVTVDGEIKI